jgi:hypothetical protein
LGSHYSETPSMTDSVFVSLFLFFFKQARGSEVPLLRGLQPAAMYFNLTIRVDTIHFRPTQTR